MTHTTCLTYTSVQLTSVAKYQTTTTLSGTTLGTGNRTATTTIGYRGTEVSSVQDASQGASDATTFTRGAGTVTVVRKGTPNATTTYGLQAATDADGRVKDVTRTLGTGGITERTTWDTTYPIEPASVVDNYGASPSRTVLYTYIANSMGLLGTVKEPLDGDPQQHRRPRLPLPLRRCARRPVGQRLRPRPQLHARPPLQPVRGVVAALGGAVTVWWCFKEFSPIGKPAFAARSVAV